MENKTLIQKQIDSLQPQFAKIIDGKLDIAEIQKEGYKPLVFAEIPKEFDQIKQYVVQGAAVEGKIVWMWGLRLGR